jgi:small-conductance mechanosensitive channel
MNDLFSLARLDDLFQHGRLWFTDNILVQGNLLQAVVILIALVIGEVLGRQVRRYTRSRAMQVLPGQIHLESLANEFFHLLPAIFGIAIVLVCTQVMRQSGYSTFMLSTVATLLAPWVAIKLASSVILDRFWAKLIAVSAWTLAALDILGLLGPAAVFLGGVGFTIGEINLTALSILKVTVLLLVFLRAGIWVGDYLEGKLKNIQDLSPSTSELLSKIVKISVFTIVVMVAMSSVGIDFATLAVFSGAVGVGIGFGLQKVVANLISGMILLVDKSIKPGDVIQVGDVYGWITHLRGRFVSVSTRDGAEYLIPNEDLITQQVINWSFSNNQIRLKVPIGISYRADPHRAIELVLETTRDEPRILRDPEPVCLLMGFGDSSVDLELRFWITDPQNGMDPLSSHILLKVWDAFKEHGVEIPFPQRDVHIDASSPIRVISEPPGQG